MPARTIVVNPDTPGPSLSFALPANVTMSVQAVLAAIDASGSGDVTATLTIADSSGAVIARKRQGAPVTGGGLGSATWALRLDDEQAPASAVVAPSWQASLVLDNNTAQGLSVTGTVTDNANPVLALSLGKLPLSVTWQMGVGSKVEANVVNLDTVTHRYAAGLAVQNTVTGARETVRGNIVTVAGHNVASFSFGPPVFGAALLNLTNPLIPTIVAAGVYAFLLGVARVP